MNILWIILAVLGFAGGQILLFRCLKRLDKLQENKPGNEPSFADEDSCRYPEEDVVE